MYVIGSLKIVLNHVRMHKYVHFTILNLLLYAELQIKLTHIKHTLTKQKPMILQVVCIGCDCCLWIVVLPCLFTNQSVL